MTVSHSVDQPRHIMPSWNVDERGAVAEVWHLDDGFPTTWSYALRNRSSRAGTVRGLHLQTPPQGKLVTCIRGAVLDVAVDVRANRRPASVFRVELTAQSGDSLWVPPGWAHGIQALQDDTEILYLLDAPRNPGGEIAIRWDDPEIAAQWAPFPDAAPILSERDALAPTWAELRARGVLP